MVRNQIQVQKSVIQCNTLHLFSVFTFEYQCVQKDGVNKQDREIEAALGYVANKRPLNLLLRSFQCTINQHFYHE